MQKYEMVLMLPQNISDKDKEFVLVKVRSLLTKIHKEHTWGLRKLLYKIGQNKKAYYYIFQFESTPKDANAINTELNIVTGVLRYLVERVEDFSDNLDIKEINDNNVKMEANYEALVI